MGKLQIHTGYSTRSLRYEYCIPYLNISFRYSYEYGTYWSVTRTVSYSTVRRRRAGGFRRVPPPFLAACTGAIWVPYPYTTTFGKSETYRGEIPIAAVPEMQMRIIPDYPRMGISQDTEIWRGYILSWDTVLILSYTSKDAK